MVLDAASRLCTCEDVLAQSGGAAVFHSVVAVLRGGGALQVLHGQTLTQDVLLQVGTWPKLSIKSRTIGERTKNVHEKMMVSHSIWFARLHKDENTASVVSICGLHPTWGVFSCCFVFSFRAIT